MYDIYTLENTFMEERVAFTIIKVTKFYVLLTKVSERLDL